MKAMIQIKQKENRLNVDLLDLLACCFCCLVSLVKISLTLTSGGAPVWISFSVSESDTNQAVTRERRQQLL